MPDIHAGAGCTIGTTMTLGKKVVPNLVGVDIGCGMAVAVLKETQIDLQPVSYTHLTRMEAAPLILEVQEVLA